MSEERNDVLVQDQQCERIVLGTILRRCDDFYEVSDYLDADCFYNTKHREMFEAIMDVFNEGLDPDIITVTAKLAKKGSDVQAFDVADVYQSYSRVGLLTYALRLKELSTRRKLWFFAQRILPVGMSETDDVEKMQQDLMDGISGLFGKSKSVFTLEDSIKSLSEMMQRNMSGDRITGTATGFGRIDEKGGLQKSDLIIVAGETSQGKTSLSLSIVCNAIRADAKVAMYSLEMTRQQLSSRLIASLSGVSSSQILYGSSFTDWELKEIDRAKGMLAGCNLYFDDNSTSNIESILLSIRNMKMKYDIDGAVIDYLQILGVNSIGTSREQQMGDASRRLKNIAKELNIWVIALSQLSRNSSDPVPNLNRLRDSGQIAEAADVVILIYRPEYYGRGSYPPPYEDAMRFPVRGTAMIDVAKGRNIGTFQFFLGFDNKTTSFHETDNVEEFEPEVYEMPVEEDAPF